MRVLAVTLPILAAVGALLFFRERQLGAELTDRPADYSPRLDEPRAGHDYLRIFAVGDVGTGDWRQRRVADAMERLAANSGGVDQILLLGDIFYPHGILSAEDERWESDFREMYTGSLLDTSFRPISGNHDLDGSLEALVDYAQLDERWKMEGLHYSFTRPLPVGTESDALVGTVAFFGIDTTAMLVSEEGLVGELEWLEAELAEHSATWRVVFGHHPVESGGLHGGEPLLQEHLLPLLIEHKIDLYVAGHDHYLGLLEIEGLSTVVSGAGGKSRPASWTPSTRFAAARLGFNEFLFSATELLVRFYESSGELLYSERISKAPTGGN